MIPNKNLISGEVKIETLIDVRTAVWSPFDLPSDTPMMNPITLELRGEWENGWYLGTNLYKVENNKIIECYSLNKIEI